jgi:hypothetical protein
MTTLHSELIHEEIMETMITLGFKRVGSRAESLCYYHLYKHATGPYMMFSCGDTRLDYMDINVGRMFSDPNKRSPSEMYEFTLSTQYHLLLEVLEIDWKSWLKTEKNSGAPIYCEKICGFLSHSVPIVLSAYSLELIAELERSSGTLAVVNQNDWCINVGGWS